MRDLIYYTKQAEAAMLSEIKIMLKDGPVPITQSCTINSKKDLEKKSVQIAMKSVTKIAGQKAYNKAQEFQYRMVMPKPDQKLNGIPLDNGIILPVYAPGTHEDHEITLPMIASGLYMALNTEFDEYYYKLLKSFDLSFVSEEMRSKIMEWGEKSEEN